MKKRVFVLVLASLIFSNSVSFSASYVDKQIKASQKAQKFNSAQKYATNYDSSLHDLTKAPLALKDPKLITFESDKIKKVNDKLFLQKLNQDEIFYTKNVASNLISKRKYNVEATKDFYNLYRVAERIIRANKLDYANWRICLAAETIDVNAMATSGNLIYINSALYDSIYNNEDAIAFVLAHEISHLILNHRARKEELRHSVRNKIYTTAVYSAAAIAEAEVVNTPTSRYLLKQYREMEYEADNLGMELVVRAGYDFNKAMNVMDFLDIITNQKETRYDTHPLISKRISNLNETEKYFLAQWVEEGKNNIYNSKPLECKISSDRGSIILSSSNQNPNGYYKQESTEDLLKRIGYIEYKNGNMKNAIKYFNQWAEMTNSYIPHLYLSYCYENLYKQNNNSKLLEKAKEEAATANSIMPNEQNVTKQLVDVASL